MYMYTWVGHNLCTHLLLIKPITIISSSQVGACIAEKNFSQVVGIGYNAMPHANSKNNDEIFPWKGAKKDKNNPTLKYSYGKN